MNCAWPRLLAAMIGVTVLAGTEPLFAQELSQLQPGQRVRVTIPSAGLLTREATFRSTGAGTITIRTERYMYVGAGMRSLKTDTVELTVPIDSVRSLEQSLGTRNFGAQGAVIGGIAGWLIVGALAVQSTQQCIARGGWFCGSPTVAFVFGGGLGGLAGGGLGALIGLSIKTEEWQPVPLSRIRVGIAPLSSRRFTLGASLAF